MQTGIIRTKTKLKTGWIYPLMTAGCFFLACAWFSSALAGVTSSSSSTWFVDMNEYAGAAHGSLKCEDCHGSMIEMETHEKAAKSHPDTESPEFLTTPVKRTFDYGSCKKCHKKAHERFREGEHAKAAVSEKKNGTPSKTGFAPTCGDCHSAHYSKSHSSRVEIGKQMTETCGACHQDQKTSFMANYHGKAGVNLGYEKAAFCTDCHGAHTTLSLKDKETALMACRRCHPAATPEFANIIIHGSTNNPDLKNDTKKSSLKWVHIMAGLSLTFVAAVLAFFYMHTGLLMLRKLHEKLRRHK